MTKADRHLSSRPSLLGFPDEARVSERHGMPKDEPIGAGPLPDWRPPRPRGFPETAAAGWRAGPGVEVTPVEPGAASRQEHGMMPARSRSPRGRTEVPEPVELTELPSSYGHTQVRLMEIDPYAVHAYWEITPEDRDATTARLGREGTSARWVLRFYDVTHIDFDGTNAHGHFDQPIDPGAGNWYTKLWSSEKSYCAHLGALAPSGRFEPACCSNSVHTPRAVPASHYHPVWLRVDDEFRSVERVTAIAPGTPCPGQGPQDPWHSTANPVPSMPPIMDEGSDGSAQGSPVTMTATAAWQGAPSPGEERPARTPVSADDPRGATLHDTGGESTGPAATPHSPAAMPPAGITPAAIRRPDRVREVFSSRTVGSFGSGGFSPGTGPPIDLKLNAEMVISGRAQPGQTLQVNGQWVTVNADGTFRVRLALPTGK